uniref:Reverse transcriptase domain-containing protein n=1 Tax=Tanacetum cinerariifolium TaxID=118510 RepID=A0A6L2NIM0_TANCI|nr:hypothetical protein [Tanacetum cinerariifolium]
MVMEIEVEANLIAEVVAEGPCTRLEGVRIRNFSTVNLLNSKELPLIIPKNGSDKEDNVERTTATCYEYEEQGHYNYMKLKNQNCGNQTGNGKAWGTVYALGRGGEANQDPNNIANNDDA